MLKIPSLPAGALAALLFSFGAQAACRIENSDRSPAPEQSDTFYRLLAKQASCPPRAQDLKALLSKGGAKVQPAMVGNRGFHNPEAGSFSFFETVSGQLEPVSEDIAEGELFFGHFTAATKDHELVLDQEPEAGKLLVELIAWDKLKGLYNFYELIGQEKGAQWFYRGDSADILRDNAFLYRDPPSGQPKFGQTLRCSACHTSGGPIMKELAYPHNDWWREARPLPLGSNNPSREMGGWLSTLIDASQFAAYVKAGIQRLETSPAYSSAKSSLSLQEQLRPLFCENEINLESSPAPLGSPFSVQVPSAFLLNPLLAQVDATIAPAFYEELLRAAGMHFPETTRPDADHPWLSPVKGYSDLLAIESLIHASVIDEKFALAVLSLDIEHPLFSRDRCSLLKLLPLNRLNWQSEFIRKLEVQPSPVAQELVKTLAGPLTALELKERAHTIAHELEQRALGTEEFQRLLSLRQAVRESEISQNPRGQILEPGFRVIFPEPQPQAEAPENH